MPQPLKLGHWAAALVALGWVARVIGVGRPMALGRLLMAMGAPEAYLCQWDSPCHWLTGGDEAATCGVQELSSAS